MQKSLRFAATALTLPVVLLVWQASIRVQNPEQNQYGSSFPSFVSFVQTAYHMLSGGEIIADALSSVARVVAGFVLGAFVGVLLGALTGTNDIVNRTIGQLLQILRPVPAIAVVPLVVLSIGIGEGGKLLLIGFAAFFPSWIATHLGIQGTPKEYLWAARTMQLSYLRRLSHVLLPASAPVIVAGLRTAFGIAFYALIAAEMAGASQGLAYRITVSHAATRIDRMLVAIAALGLVGAATDFVFARVIRSRIRPRINSFRGDA